MNLLRVPEKSEIPNYKDLISNVGTYKLKQVEVDYIHYSNYTELI